MISYSSIQSLINNFVILPKEGETPPVTTRWHETPNGGAHCQRDGAGQTEKPDQEKL